MINRKRTGQFPNIWKINNKLLNNPWAKEEVSMGEKISELNELKIQHIKICVNRAISVPREQFIALNSYIGKEETSQIKDLNSYLKHLEKEQNKPETCRRK